MASGGEQTPGQAVLVLQGGGALGAYQVGVYQALHEAGVEGRGGCVAEASRIKPTACRNTGIGTSSSPESQRSRLAAVALRASPSASTPPHHSTARRKVIIGTSELRIRPS